ncbi:MAG: hypothetical protein ABIN94_14565 [Ferruginibacter sp.]
MKKTAFIFSFVFLLMATSITMVNGQCSLCTKTAQQMGEKPALGLNNGILYLMVMPFAIMGVIGFRWWKNNKEVEEQES